MRPQNDGGSISAEDVPWWHDATGRVYYDFAGQPISRETWESLGGDPERHVARDWIDDRYLVSTIWIGDDRREGEWDGGQPLIYETVACRAANDNRELDPAGTKLFRRYPDRETAIAGHSAAVDFLKRETAVRADA